MKKLLTSSCLVVTLFALGGCLGASQNASHLVDFTPPKRQGPVADGTFAAFRTTAGNITTSYLDTAALYANEQQAFDLPILAAAATAATALTFGWSTDWIKIAGISAGSLYAIKNYYKSDARIGIMLGGVSAVDCVHNLAAVANTKPFAAKYTTAGATELNGGLDRIEDAVAQKSLQQVSSLGFSDTASLIIAQSRLAARQEQDIESKKSASVAAAGADAGAKQAAETAAEVEKFYNDLPAKVTACVAKAK